jgi:segregation and condensation protein A
VAQSPKATAALEAPLPGFSVSLNNFNGPFDLLLTLIAKHELDITEISLSVVTGEFIAYLRELDSLEELDQATEFLVVAATLRDLLFARLLQYRAFKQAAEWFSTQLENESTRHYRSVRLEEKYRQQTPELVWTLSVDDFAALAALAMAPREIPMVGLDHLHAPLVSIREQAAIVVALLRRGETMSFRQLIAGANVAGVVVARFLAVLELYRNAAISFEQLEPLGELSIRWTAEHFSEDSLANLGADYDN